MFSDSKIAATYGCGATKIAGIINHAIVPSLHSCIFDLLRAKLFSLSVYESSDTGTESMNLRVVKIYDSGKGETSSLFWTMALLVIVQQQEFSKGEFMGKHKGFFTHFVKKTDFIYTFECPCHIIPNTALQDQMQLLKQQIVMLMTP